MLWYAFYRSSSVRKQYSLRSAFVVSINSCTHGGMLEKEIQRSYLLRYLFIRIINLFQLIFLLIYYYFLIVYNQHTFRNLSLAAFETVKIYIEEKLKSMILWQFCSFPNFSSFANLGIDFNVSTETDASELWSILLELRYLFVKTVTHYKTDLKHKVTMRSHHRYCVTHNDRCIKFYCSTVRRSWIKWAK